MAQTIKLKRSATSGATPTTSQLELGEVAINTYDGKMYIKKNVGGTESIVEITGGSGGSSNLSGLSDVTISSAAADQLLQYNGSEWVNVSIAEASAIMKEYQFTATAGQSTFSGSDDNSETLSYTAGAIQVFLNGIFLDSAVDYTATNGTSIVLSETVDANDYLQVVAFKKKIGDGNVSVDTFTGDDSTTAFTLSVDPGDENNTRVFIDGVYQSKSNYSVSGTTLTFSTAPPTDTAVEVEIGNRVVTLDTLSDLDLPDDVKLRLGTDQDLQIYHDGSNGFIKNTTGDLYIEDSNGSIRIRPKTGESGINVLADSSVELYYDNSKKLETSNDGVTVTGDVEADEFIGDVRGAVLFKAQAGETLAKGEVVYISGISGNTTIVSKADADDASKMPAFGLVAAAASSGNPVDIYTNGILSGIDTSSYSEGDELFVSTTAGALTATPPTGESSALQKIGKVTRSASSGSIFIVGAGRSNAVPNLDDGDIFIGNASNQAVTASLNTKIEDYLDAGTSTPTFAGLATTANMTFGDNDKAIFGAGSDLQIYHDGSHSYVKDAGTGILYVQGSSQVRVGGADGTTGVEVNEGGDVKLRYNNANKLATTSTGIDVTGTAAADAFTFDNYTLDSNKISTNQASGYNGDIFLDAANVVVLDAANAGVVQLKNNGSHFGSFFVSSDSLNIQSNISDADIVFKGNDGGSAVTALTLDMSDAGAAYFNSSITVTGTNANLTLGASGNDITFGRNADNYINAQAGTSSNIVINPENRFVVNTSDTERMRIDSSGNVGIGVNNPGSYYAFANNLVVGGDSANRAGISIAGSTTGMLNFTDGTGLVGFIEYNHTSDSLSMGTAATTALSINAQQKVGIGTTVPNRSDFNIHGANRTLASTTSQVAITASDSIAADIGGSLHFGARYDTTTTDFAPTGYVAGRRENATVNNYAGYLQFGVTQGNAGTIEAMRITSTGNVGIGTDSPNAMVHAKNTTSAAQIKISDSTNTAELQVASNGFYLNNPVSAGTFIFRNGTGYTERMRIGSSGNVGIGTTNPDSKLHISGAGNTNIKITAGANSSASLRLVNDAHDWDVNCQTTDKFAIYSHTAGTARLVIDTSGNVGIGTTSPFAKSHIVDTGWSSGAPYGTVQLIEGNDVNDNNWGHLVVTDTSTANGNGGAISFATGASTALNPFSGIKGISEGTSYGGLGLFTRANGGTATERMRITSTGRVRINNNNSSWDALGTLLVKQASNNVGIGIVDQNSTNTFQIRNNGTYSEFYYNVNNPIVFSQSGGERMRIDSSGNLLVAKTSLNDNLAGFQTSPSGETRITRSGGLTLVLNRKTSDGEILGFRKDGTVVGNIGTYGTDLYIGTNDSGLRFEYAGLNSIVPFDVNSLAISDAATDLGHANARFKDLNLSGTVNAGTALVENAKLKAIAESNTDTAVDVFVYDTRKDSDGGAWRKRTQNTSWYNETLNTSTRGARKEFPCVAVIVYEEDQLTIYDGDDPTLPMWLIINAGGGHPLYSGGTSNTCEALNGEILAGCGGPTVSGALSHFNFIKDLAYLRISTSSAYNSVTIANRNIGFPSDTITGTTGALVNRIINDVAMTVLPNAPIDADTGLPVPTIAVATDGGVSVIKDDGTVVDIVTNTLSHETPMEVKFIGDKIFWLGQNNYDNGWSSGFTAKIPNADVSVIYLTGVGSLTKYSSFEWSLHLTNGSDISIPIAMASPRTGAFIEAGTNDELIFGGKGADKHGTVVKVVENLSDPESGMLAQIASDYATGYQVGDIKLAALSDTDTTNVTGTELVTNGTFDSNTTGWTVNSAGTATSTNGQLVLTNTTADRTRLNTTFTTEVGKTYVFTYEVISGNAFAHVDSIHFNIGLNQTGVHTHTFEARYTSTALQLGVSTTGNGDTVTIDNVSVRLAEEDRSWNGNGLQVFGTVTKSAVATGAELVGYSGFSSSNYLQQPYNSALDFGTGDFSIIGWYSGSADGRVLLERLGADQDGTTSGATDETDRLYIYTAVGKIYLQVGTDNFATPAPSDGTYWRQLAVVRRSGTIYVYQNGIQYLSRANTQNVGDTDHILRIGTGIPYKVSPTTGSMALWRISATAPSEEQIVKMYNDEKHLFAENADATIAGTSDAVTALAYDEDTELLHVGSSWGRSVFQGLNRVEYSTDVVSTAISASGGFIVEE